MEEQKRPHIPAWKVWLLVITTTMAISAVQNFIVHHQMWKEIHNNQYSLSLVLQNDVEYYQKMNRALDLILQELYKPTGMAEEGE